MIYKTALELRQRNVVIPLDGSEPYADNAVRESGVFNINGRECFVHCIAAEPTINIFGAGHISRALSQICALLGFHVRVIDDRAELLNDEYFPDADELTLCRFERIGEYITPQPQDYNVIVTSGHEHDLECAELVLSGEFFYAGMIGSKSKSAQVKKLLREKGCDPDKLHAPIGLMIGAQTPEEIAVSIAAQLIEAKYENGAGYIPRKLAALIRSDERYTLGVIIEKSGSAPRGIGSMMAVCSDGRTVGTIGGGAAERGFVDHADNAAHMEIIEYDMTPGNEMICGGRIKVLVLKGGG